MALTKTAKTWLYIIGGFIVLSVLANLFFGDEMEEANRKAEEKRQQAASAENAKLNAEEEKRQLAEQERLAVIEKRKLERDSLELKFSWTLGGFGKIVMLEVELINKSKGLTFDAPILDINFLASNKDNLKNIKKRLPIELAPGKRYKSEELNLGFKPDFLEYVNCSVSSVNILHRD
jgi:hypothetical protein